MFNKFEIIGAAISVSIMALAIYLVQVESIFFAEGATGQKAEIIEAQKSAVIIENGIKDDEKFSLYKEAFDSKGNVKNMIIDDIKLGVGGVVKNGDVVSVHYVGTFQDGREFDSSRKRGEAFEFEVGAGSVIKGWDEGILGMQIGGHRVLVVPPDMAYGRNGVGPIPGNSTLVFAIELIDIKNDE